MWEIELKIRVDNPEDMKIRLGKLGVFGGSYQRQDIYFSQPDASPPQTAFRLRRDGREAWVTHKFKTLHNGIEQSLETEFLVQPAEAFEKFVHSLGYAEMIRKEKKGDWWNIGTIKAELSEVPPLGWWLELEALVSEDSPQEKVDTAKAGLISILTQLGKGAPDIEERPYTQLLKENLFRG